MNKILVLAAHPDDEILECGGTIAKLVRTGKYTAEAVIVCEGESLRYKGMAVDQRSATKQAADIIGYSRTRCLNFPDQRLDTYSLIEINQAIEQICDEIRPSIVFTHWRGDLNRDHQIVSESACVALRPTAEYVKEIFMFCNSATQIHAFETFKPNVWVDISETLEQKNTAFSCYKSEIKEYPHARSTEAIEYTARTNGVLCGCRAAECFYLYRRVL